MNETSPQQPLFAVHWKRLGISTVHVSTPDDKEGARLGETVGFVGERLGADVGVREGLPDGGIVAVAADGLHVGDCVGGALGLPVGTLEGVKLGALVGDVLGRVVGTGDGLQVGIIEAPSTDGLQDGDRVGNLDGAIVGYLLVGCWVGILDGAYDGVAVGPREGTGEPTALPLMITNVPLQAFTSQHPWRKVYPTHGDPVAGGTIVSLEHLSQVLPVELWSSLELIWFPPDMRRIY